MLVFEGVMDCWFVEIEIFLFIVVWCDYMECMILFVFEVGKIVFCDCFVDSMCMY